MQLFYDCIDWWVRAYCYECALIHQNEPGVADWLRAYAWWRTYDVDAWWRACLVDAN